MIDPASAIAIATTAFSGIKKAISAGKEISQLGKDISAFGKAVSDLDYMGAKAKDPPLWRKLDLSLIPLLLKYGRINREPRRCVRS